MGPSLKSPPSPTKPHRKTVVIGFLGTQLDGGLTEKRWARWRPTLSLVAQPDFQPDALELLQFGGHTELCDVVRADVLKVRPETEVRMHFLPSKNYWDFAQVYAALHEFASRYPFREDTDYYVHITTGTHVAQICLFLLTEARYFPARLLQSRTSPESALPWRGALDIVDLDLGVYDALRQRMALESRDSQTLLRGGIESRNPAFNALMQRLEKVALRSKAPVLLSGPTGCGKTQLAKRIFELKRRRHQVKGELVELNCATLQGEQAMSALFGHTRGAFTGAANARAGLLKTAHEGLLFLDEIGSLGLDEQAMLLKALEEKHFLPVGSDKLEHSDFQLLAGTNQDLWQAVREGRFREDLLARLSVWHFELPSLAQRPEDIEPNLEHELKRLSRELGCHVRMTAEARELFLRRARLVPWPGNFRDFAATLTRMATLCDAGLLTPADVEQEMASGPALPPVDFAGQTGRPVALGAPTQADHSQNRIPVFCEELAQAQELDAMQRAQLGVLLHAVAQSESMAQAGRVLFATPSAGAPQTNLSDRVKKTLARFGLTFAQARQRLA